MNNNFNNERSFADAFIDYLIEHGWSGFAETAFQNTNDIKTYNQTHKVVLKNVTEKDLIQNWQSILFHNNKDVLNHLPLTDTEMEQIITKINQMSSISLINETLIGGYIEIQRDNPQDVERYGKKVLLNIFNRHDVGAGKSVYQIANEVELPNDVLKKRRADIMLLINGIPLIHIELKNSNHAASEAIQQISTYHKNNCYKGIFAMVQMLVALKPEKMLYMPNTKNNAKIKESSFVEWFDFQNQQIKDWRKIVNNFFCIPTVHRIIADSTVSDSSDGELKILRSYQYHAINKIYMNMSREDFWGQESHQSKKGGYVWHTTGSGKTLTSFKLAQLLLEWHKADIVVFLADRDELIKQTQIEFGNFAESGTQIEVINIEGTAFNLFNEIYKSSNIKKLIITSIQKQKNINESLIDYKKLAKANSKRIVFIFDEAHRSTSGKMYLDITKTFNNSIVYGFTGTPLFKENAKNDLVTNNIFGDLIHSYTIKDGIKDKKVLQFHIDYVFEENLYLFYIILNSDQNQNLLIGNTVQEKYDYFLKNKTKIQKLRPEFFVEYQQLSEALDANAQENIEIEKELESFGFYKLKAYKEFVVKNILKNWLSKSSGQKFSAIFATSSIQDAIEYYKIFKESKSDFGLQDLTITTLFDPSIDVTETFDKTFDKKTALNEIITDYNQTFKTNWSLEDPAEFKVDLSNRLARKANHINVKEGERLDLLIVVNQMLTGFDSKYLNSIYFDKKIEFENLIQAISRTNRILDDTKPFGNVVFYKKPNTMKSNLKEAFRLYADSNLAVIEANNIEWFLNRINESYTKIKEIFEIKWGVNDLGTIPDVEKGDKEFNEFYIESKSVLNEIYKIDKHLNSAKILGFDWNNIEYDDLIKFNKHIHNKLKARFNDLSIWVINNKSDNESCIEEQDEQDLYVKINEYSYTKTTEIADLNYINELLIKYSYKVNNNDKDQNLKNQIQELIKVLPKKLQVVANKLLDDISNKMQLDENFNLRTYIEDYLHKEKNARILNISNIFGVNKQDLLSIINSNDHININGRFDNLLHQIKNETSVKEYIATLWNENPKKIKRADFNIVLKDFILKERKQ
ncbi:HsdR family type I site-specific deoxyribonuclease [Mycoplasma leonicaptivi]|uniref:HsdR family type I site-specific deoxyribonuclease n=1 Tax=Mycoplasma leonicaptivi TaxID=36742 RepID=UPI00047F0BBC|nr:HsdR family type I site-specific deoxyribonuclease [Mycoplasma leonicaptivi]